MTTLYDQDREDEDQRTANLLGTAALVYVLFTLLERMTLEQDLLGTWL